MLCNQSRLEGAAKAIDRAGSPTFAVVEERDVSAGLAIEPPQFTAIVFNESDELGLSDARRSADWSEKHGAWVSGNGSGIKVYDVMHLSDHFYLATLSYVR